MPPPHLNNQTGKRNKKKNQPTAHHFWGQVAHNYNPRKKLSQQQPKHRVWTRPGAKARWCLLNPLNAGDEPIFLDDPGPSNVIESPAGQASPSNSNKQIRLNLSGHNTDSANNKQSTQQPGQSNPNQSFGQVDPGQVTQQGNPSQDVQPNKPDEPMGTINTGQQTQPKGPGNLKTPINKPGQGSKFKPLQEAKAQSQKMTKSNFAQSNPVITLVGKQKQSITQQKKILKFQMQIQAMKQEKERQVKSVDMSGGASTSNANPNPAVATPVPIPTPVPKPTPSTSNAVGIQNQNFPGVAQSASALNAPGMAYPTDSTLNLSQISSEGEQASLLNEETSLNEENVDETATLVYKKRKMLCFYCGHRGHTSPQCYFKIDLELDISSGLIQKFKNKKWCLKCGSKEHLAIQCRSVRKDQMCYKCGKKGHMAPTCRRSGTIRSVTKTVMLVNKQLKIKCSKCGKLGHFRPVCPLNNENQAGQDADGTLNNEQPSEMSSDSAQTITAHSLDANSSLSKENVSETVKPKNRKRRRVCFKCGNHGHYRTMCPSNANSRKSQDGNGTLNKGQSNEVSSDAAQTITDHSLDESSSLNTENVDETAISMNKKRKIICSKCGNLDHYATTCTSSQERQDGDGTLKKEHSSEVSANCASTISTHSLDENSSLNEENVDETKILVDKKQSITCYKCGNKGHKTPQCRFVTASSMNESASLNEENVGETAILVDKKQSVTCYKCGNKGHKAPKCRIVTASSVNESSSLNEENVGETAILVDKKQSVTCYNCGNKGHMAPQCRFVTASSVNENSSLNEENVDETAILLDKKQSVTCYKCGKKGHKSTKCRFFQASSVNKNSSWNVEVNETATLVDDKRMCHKCGIKGHIAPQCRFEPASSVHENSSLNEESVDETAILLDKKQSVTCYKCGRKGHKSTKCRFVKASSVNENSSWNVEVNNETATSVDDKRTCHKCGIKGHIAPQCRFVADSSVNENSSLNEENVDETAILVDKKQSVTCYKCGRKGHKSTKCRYVKASSVNENSSWNVEVNETATSVDDKRTCHKCGIKGHIASQCRFVADSSVNENSSLDEENVNETAILVDKKQSVTCYKCGNKGHKAPQCRFAPASSVNENASLNEESEDETAILLDKKQSVTCYKCGRKGHKSTKCRFVKASSVNENSSWSVEVNETATSVDDKRTCHKCGIKGHIAPQCRFVADSSVNENTSLNEENVNETAILVDKKQSATCYKCGNKGHKAPQCRFAPASLVNENASLNEESVDETAILVDKKQSVTCYKCGRKGHKSTKCRFVKASSVNENSSWNVELNETATSVDDKQSCRKCGIKGHMAPQCRFVTGSSENENSSLNEENVDEMAILVDKNQSVTCYKCDIKGHIASQCRSVTNSSLNENSSWNVDVNETAISVDDERTWCYKCGIKGHIAPQCRSVADSSVNENTSWNVGGNEKAISVDNMRPCFKFGNMGHIAYQCHSVTDSSWNIEKVNDTTLACNTCGKIGHSAQTCCRSATVQSLDKNVGRNSNNIAPTSSSSRKKRNKKINQEVLVHVDSTLNKSNSAEGASDCVQTIHASTLNENSSLNVAENEKAVWFNRKPIKLVWRINKETQENQGLSSVPPTASKSSDVVETAFNVEVKQASFTPPLSSQSQKQPNINPEINRWTTLDQFGFAYPKGIPKSFLTQQQKQALLNAQVQANSPIWPTYQAAPMPVQPPSIDGTHTLFVQTDSQPDTPQQYSPSELYSDLDSSRNRESMESESSEQDKSGKKRLSAFRRLGPQTQPKKPKLTISLIVNDDQEVREVVDETVEQEEITPVHLREDMILSTDETVRKYLKAWPWKRTVAITKCVTARSSKTVMMLEREQMEEIYDKESLFLQVTVRGYPPSWKKERVLNVLMDNIRGYHFIPCFIEFTREVCKFLTLRCRSALLSLHKCGFMIRTDEVELTMSISQTQLTLNHVNFVPRLVLRQRLLMGYDRDTKLDLSAFTLKEDISYFIYYPLNREYNQSELVQMQTSITWEFLTHLNLSHNGITSLDGFDFEQKMPSIKHLNLSHNRLERITVLLKCRNLPLKSIHLEGNPLCTDYMDPDQYVRVIRMMFPAVTEIDDTPVHFKGDMPIFKRNYCPTDAKELVDKFLEIYFPLMDGDIEHRLMLEEMYEEDANMTITYNFKIAFGPIYRCFKTLFHHARQFEEGRMDMLRGSTAIVKAIANWPHTEHDPFTFTVDVICHTDTMTVLRIDGILKLTRESLAEDEHILSFCRTLVLHTRNGNEYRIQNEMLHWNIPTGAYAKSAFAVTAIKTKQMNPKIDSTTDEKLQKELLKIFMQLTTMDTKISERCLEIKKWNLREALVHFTKLVKLDGLDSLAKEVS